MTQLRKITPTKPPGDRDVRRTGSIRKAGVSVPEDTDVDPPCNVVTTLSLYGLNLGWTDLRVFRPDVVKKFVVNIRFSPLIV